jgi:hypothetical protein
MSTKFKIEEIFELKGRDKICVLAKLLDIDSSFQLTDKSRLGEVEIENWFDIPRKLDDNGNIRVDLYAFLLKNKLDLNKIQKR